MNPAAHSGLRTAVNIETNLALHFRRGDALDFQCPVLCLGQRAAGLLFGFGSNGFGPELRLDAYCFRFGLQRLFACLYDGLTVRWRPWNWSAGSLPSCRRLLMPYDSSFRAS